MPTDDSLRLPPSLNLSFPKITSACNDDAIRTRLGVNFQEVVHSAPARLVVRRGERLVNAGLIASKCGPALQDECHLLRIWFWPRRPGK
jgi:hypothetical protein